MTAVKQIEASARAQVGKGAARAVRRQGLTPAVIYGGGAAPEAIALDANKTRLLIYGGHFLTTLYEIDVAGKKTRVIPRDYQLDPVKDFPIHVDFLRVAAGQTVKVEVPIHVIGQDASPGIKNGGAVQIVEHSLEIDVEPEQHPGRLRGLRRRARNRRLDRSRARSSCRPGAKLTVGARHRPSSPSFRRWSRGSEPAAEERCCAGRADAKA